MYRVTCAAILAAPWLVLASVPTAEATDKIVGGGLKDGPPAPIVYNWTGFHIGAGGGVSWLDADLTAKSSRTDTVFKCHRYGYDYKTKTCKEEKIHPLYTFEQNHQFKVGDSGDAEFFGTVQVGYDKQVESGHVVGIFADVDWGSTGASFNQKSIDYFYGYPLEATASGKIEQDWGFTIGARFGWLKNPRTLFYVLAGYTRIMLDDPSVHFKIQDPFGFIKHIDTPTHLTVNLPDELDGITLGAGIEKMLKKNWSLKLEYRYTNLEDGDGAASSHEQQCCVKIYYKKIGRLIDADAMADCDGDLHSARVVLSYKFGGREAYVPPLK